ncbi:MAG TPA: efflux transporter outer membrane subunit [Steroidobacteraceae bacterium]|nr:efflux transporter outer membrane subunit [Steroidobacteraceae bacterium]
MPRTPSTASLALLGAVLLGLAACTVGPDYKGPPAAAIPAGGFKRALAGTNAAAPVARWWTALGDPELDRLVGAALEASPTVEAAQARVREARANYMQQRAGLRPTTGSSALYLRTKNPLDPGGGDLNLYTLGFDASWELDLFGGTRRAVEAAGAAAQASEASLRDVRVSLSAEVADAYVQLRDAQRRLALTRRNADIDAHLLDLMQIRRNGGTASDLDVERIVNQLDSTRATLGPLRALTLAQLDRLAVLTAQAPGALDAELAPAAAVPVPPATVAVGDPAALLRRRPDVVAAERRLAQSTAVIGQNVAALFPKVSLLGFLGFGATSAGTLFNGSSFTPVVAPLLQWTPFDFGRTRGRINQARAARDEAEADYHEAVLGALEDAETSLAQYGEQRGTVADLARVQQSAEKVYSMTEIRLRGGTAATTDVLDADTRRIQAELDYQQALAQLTRDYIALQKSLGLGWVEPAADTNAPAR